MTRRAPWFGRLLDWQWNPETQMHATWHDGRSHHIAKMSRQTADARGRGASPGWCIWENNPNNDPDRRYGFGPRVGSTVEVAKRNAEAWIICSYGDLMGYPSLSGAMQSSSGIGYEGLIIYRDDPNQRFTVRRGDADPARVGVILPVFIGPAGTIRIRWRACGPQEQIISAHDTWADAVRALHGEVNP